VRLAIVFVFVLALGLGRATGVASAAPPEPSGPHPRMLLDAKLRAAWQAALQDGRGPLVGAVTLCDEDRTRRDHDGALYMGAEWAKMLQACLVAWAATDKHEYGVSALKFFTALIDDLEKIGDGKGGDTAVARDSGYPIRNLGPYTAIAYDWLHDFPGMTPELRMRARRRWAAWLPWFRDKGYHARDPGSNYQAGYLISATLVAIAQGGEAGEESGSALWKFVADELWAKDMAAALSAGGVLDGGDWNEGWQYGPFSVAEYALAARIGKAYGLATAGITAWLDSVLRRHVYALNPSDRLWAGGDYDDDHAYMSPQVLVLDAISLGDASPDAKRWAKGELSRLKLTDKDALLYDALAMLGDPPQLVPRASWPTWYQAAATATLFTRTSWDDRAIWFVAACAQTSGLDHRSPNAGNFVLSRGAADLIVDPSPYGSLSTLAGNAPTVRSGQKLPNYLPSQLAWSEDIAWVWATKTRGGIVAARCDYSDAYRFQDRKSDIAGALRDFVLLPSADGHDASLVIFDRATTGDVDHRMYLRFRVPAELAIDKAGTGTATIKDARVTITGAYSPSLGRTALKDCFKDGTTRGNCDAARFPVTDYRVELPGPEPRALHVIDATDAGGAVKHTPLSGDGWTGVRVQGTRDAAVVWPNKSEDRLAVRAPKGQPGKPASLVVLGAPATDGKATVSAKPDGDGCAVTIAAGGPIASRPLIVTLDDACAVTADPEEPRGVTAEGKPAAPVRTKPSPRHGGCCGAQSAPGSPLAMSFVVLAVLWRRRKRLA
jgi:uncharacterized protein (TIGR03382 family)